MVAVGECGLDFYRDLSPRDAQAAAFRAQIESPGGRQPLVVHVREAGYEALDDACDACRRPHRHPALLRPGRTRGGVQRAWLLRVVRRQPDLQEGRGAAPGGPAIDEERLLVETDAPFLSPVPHRGKKTTSGAGGRHGASAGRRTRLETEVETVTTANAERVFSLSSG